MNIGPNARIPKTAFKPGQIPWNLGVKGYRNPKNSKARFDWNNPVFRDSLRPALRDCGVYAIINRKDGRIYIGSSGRLGYRIVRYRQDFSKQKDVSRPINKAIFSDPEAFEFTVIESTETREQAFDRENFWIKFYQSHLPKFGYNACPTSRSPIGCKKTSEQNAAQSARQMGRKTKPWTDKQKQRMSELLKSKGLKQSPESILKAIETKKKTKSGWKKVVQMTHSGEVIAVHDQVRIAAEAMGSKKSFSNIVAVCRGKRDLAFGFRWSYA